VLQNFFVAAKSLRQLVSGPSGPHLDTFAAELVTRGYSHWTSVTYIRAAAHFGHFAELQGIALEAVDQTTLESYRLHLPSCRCPRPRGGKMNPHALCGAKLFLNHLREIGVLKREDDEAGAVEHPLVVSFRHWLRHHRGVTAHTARQYARAAVGFLADLGDEPRGYDARSIRDFFLRRARECGNRSATRVATALRVFLHYLVAQDKCAPGLDQTVPSMAGWRLARLPRGLSGSEVSRILAVCGGDRVAGKRDRAIVLLLARLGLRAGEIATLKLSDIDWRDGSVVVSGKARREDRVPLPQEVGDALLEYLECRPRVPTDRVFLRAIAPIRPFLRGDAVSSIAKRAMRRAGVTAPSAGAHTLRHTAATQMLREGVPLYEIGSVLRHRSVETTAYYYAKVDMDLLKRVAQPWPEALR
jgi:integrase